VLGVLSLVVWSLILIVIVKYLVFVLRADNKNEGGTLALAALVSQKSTAPRNRLAIPILLALFGTGLLFGEGIITPAISVMSAVEGLSEQSPKFAELIVPISAAILIGLFWVQRYGTGRIGSVFGWIMLLWFIAIAAVGVPYIVRYPEVLQALSPHHGAIFLATHGKQGFLLLGSVCLCITGCEALYADMGHFGKSPIRVAWSFIVFPGLLLNYFGQGALYLHEGAKVSSPFYDLVSGGPLLIPMVILATLAAIIASQALISGAFSLTNQAVQLGYLPRVTVVHTSHKAEGQIYIPEVNWMLMVACVALVLAFGSSSALAAAYGIAVTGTMSITSFLFFRVALRNWSWSLGAALLFYIPFVIIDFSFFSANVVKVAAGGWFPLAVGTGLFAIMTTWWRGRHELSKTMETGTIPDELFLTDIATTKLPRVSGTAVFMSSGSDGMPKRAAPPRQAQQGAAQAGRAALGRHRERAAGTREHVAAGAAAASRRRGRQGDRPRLLPRDRARRLHAATERPQDPRALREARALTTGASKVARWRKMLFTVLARNSRPPTAFFNLPPNRVVELGLQIEL
jgi:KUP system potassium uptake protein